MPLIKFKFNPPISEIILTELGQKEGTTDEQGDFNIPLTC